MPVLQANVSLIQIAHAAGTRVSHARFISPWCYLPLRSLSAALLPLLFILGLEMKKLFFSGHVCTIGDEKARVLTSLD